MSKCDKLLTKAQQSPRNLRFEELCRLAECYGWELKRQRGSHVLYENNLLDAQDGRLMNFQDNKGKAKDYQIVQLLNAISNLDLQ